jgi:hypothetical protein
MYVKTIEPYISLFDYQVMSILVNKTAILQSRNMTYDFILALRYTYISLKMKHIAKILGVSLRHCYRLAKRVDDDAKSGLIFIMIKQFCISENYDDFVRFCEKYKIYIKSPLINIK